MRAFYDGLNQVDGAFNSKFFILPNKDFKDYKSLLFV